MKKEISDRLLEEEAQDIRHRKNIYLLKKWGRERLNCYSEQEVERHRLSLEIALNNLERRYPKHIVSLIPLRAGETTEAVTVGTWFAANEAE